MSQGEPDIATNNMVVPLLHLGQVVHMAMCRDCKCQSYMIYIYMHALNLRNMLCKKLNFQSMC